MAPAEGPDEFKTVAQLYLTYPEDAGEPRRQLKAFDKISFSRSECNGSNRAKQISLRISNTDLSTWDVATHSWKLATGEFQAVVSLDSSKTSCEASEARTSFFRK